MRPTVSTGTTQYLPSPILPVRAFSTIAVDDLVDVAVLDDDLEADLRQVLDAVLGAAVHLGVTALATVTAHLGQRDRPRRRPRGARR